MTSLRMLYELQAVDRDLDHRQERLGVIASLLGDDKAVAMLLGEVQELKSAAERAVVNQRDLENAIASFTENITQTEAKLYGGQVKSPRELLDLQADGDQLKRQRAPLEDQLLEVLEEVEELQARLGAATSRLQNEEQDWEAQQTSMAKEQRTLQGEVKGLSTSRVNMAHQVPPADLAVYEHVRRSHGGETIVRVQQGRCTACRITLPTRELQRVRIGSSPVRCPSCGRILLAE